MPGRADWAVHRRCGSTGARRAGDSGTAPGAHDGAITDAAAALPAMGRCKRRRNRPPATTQSGPIGSPPLNRPPDCCGTRPATGSTSSSSGSALAGRRRWRWCAATPTPTSRRRAVGMGLAARWCAAGRRVARHQTGRFAAALQPARPHLPDLLMCRPTSRTSCLTRCGWPAEHRPDRRLESSGDAANPRGGRGCRDIPQLPVGRPCCVFTTAPTARCGPPRPDRPATMYVCGITPTTPPIRPRRHLPGVRPGLPDVGGQRPGCTTCRTSPTSTTCFERAARDGIDWR